MFRYERPQAGRMRQFHQIGVEAFGSSSPALDVEVIAMAIDLFQTLGLKNLRVAINTLGDKQSRDDYRQALIDYLTPHRAELSADSQARLEKNPLRVLDSKDPRDQVFVAGAPSILDYLSEASQQHFQKVQALLTALNLDFEIDPTMVRVKRGCNNRGGGRYSGLVSVLGGPETAGVGFGIGMERLVSLLNAQGVAPEVDNDLDFYVVNIGDETDVAAMQIVQAIRSFGFVAERDILIAQPKPNFKTADRHNAKYVVTVGEKELAAHAANIKNMATGLIDESYLDQTVTLSGWVQKRRDFGDLIFVDLRDREGIVQLTFNATNQSALTVAEDMRNEYVVAVTGKVIKRDESQINDKIKSGAVEYRYLDLRRPEMQKNLRVRSKIMSSAMHFMDTHDFINIETPILAKSTPEGARDYLIARAFRDEDLRGDRQPEFTQMDVETSFMTADEIRALVNEWVKAMMHDVVNFDLDTTTIPTLTWQKSMDRFGTDKLICGLLMKFMIFLISFQIVNLVCLPNAVKAGGVVKAIAVPGGADHYSRKDIDKLAQYIERFGAKGLAWLKVTDDGLTGPIAKFFKPEDSQALIAGVGGQTGDLLLFGAGRNDVCQLLWIISVVKRLRILIWWTKQILGHFAWIVDWPLFEYSEDFDRWIAAHHPFTMPNEEDLHYLDDGEDPHKAHAQSYDLVLNGYELGSAQSVFIAWIFRKKCLKRLALHPKKRMRHLVSCLKAWNMVSHQWVVLRLG
ncbi:hypothetical protein Pfo_031474 [Paulownia fortunei]|nr:hypothetical protein Pfo_031474 [Paulownia fortunei]